MTYKELQSKASDLGMKNVIGVKSKTLREFISNNSTDTVDTNTAPTPEPVAVAEESIEIDDKKRTIHAVIYKGRYEVRRYTEELHGADYMDLAEQFAKNAGHRVEKEAVFPSIKCPQCGNEVMTEE